MAPPLTADCCHPRNGQHPEPKGILASLWGLRPPREKSLSQLRAGGSFNSPRLQKLPAGCLSDWDSPGLIPSFEP